MAERSPAETVRARVAEADRLRRLRDESVRVWRVAPPAAAVCLGLAAASRWAGWPAVVPFAALAVGAAVLGLMLFLVRRDREVSDATAAALDEGAALGGELRSAHWFARRDDGDPWIEFHLARAAERVQSVDWKRLYSPPPSARARIATVAMAAAALAIVLVGSRGAIAAARRTVPGSLVDVRVAGRPLPELPPELRKKLEDLLNAIETGHAGSLTGAEVRGLLAQLDELRADRSSKPGDRSKENKAGDGKAPTEADLKAFAERAKADAQNAAVQPEARDALSAMSDDLSDAAAAARKQAPKDLQDAVPTNEVQKGEAAKSASSENAGSQGESVKDTQGAGNVGVIMMTSDSGGGGDPGLGAGTPDQRGRAASALPDLGAALRHETIEAGADSTGDNLPASVKRRTEHGNATMGYAHTATGSAEHGRSAAPPRVPDARRAAVRAYFIRKQ